MAMRCPKCGFKNRDDEVFCVGCGIEMKNYRREVAKQEVCPQCGAMNKASSGRCSSCGAKFESGFTTCPECGARNLSSERRCRNCDFEIRKPVPEPVASVSPRPKITPSQGSPEPRCPKCSGPMQRGIMLAPSGGLLGGVRWDEVDGIDVWGLKGEVLASGGLMANSVRIPGFRCPTCRVLVLTY